MKLHGIFPPIATPFDYKGDLYRAKLQHNIEKWNQTNLTGYVVGGSTGESVYLTADEKVTVWEWAAEYAASNKILIAGTGTESVRETVALTNRAAALGYKAAHYYKNLVAKADVQALYFRAVADQASVPVMICNWPQATGVDIAAEAVVELSHHPNIIAIKESSGNLEKVMQIVREAKEGFQVLVGSAPTLWPSLSAGAVGAVVAFANAAPYAAITIWEAHRSRDVETARDWQSRIAKAARLVTTVYGIPGLKYAMDLNGYYGGPARLPLTPVCPQAQKEIAEAFAGIRG
jgi:4-hydroxy-2-oxoglutarate aldolase